MLEPTSLRKALNGQRGQHAKGTTPGFHSRAEDLGGEI